MSKEPKRNVYVGHRYVPKIMGEWDKQQSYEGLSIVTYQGNSYTSKKRVPVGIDITNEEYWAVTGNYNAQVEQYRQEVRDLSNYVDSEVNNLTNYVDSEVNNLTNYVNGELVSINEQLKQTKNKVEGIVSVLDFGAVGDGVTDDTQAFIDFRDYLNSLSFKGSPQDQYNSFNGITAYVPRGTYRVKGSHIFGTPHENGYVYPNFNNRRKIQYIMEGATFIWEILNENDILFNLDHFYYMPKFENFNITPINRTTSKTVGTVFNIWSGSYEQGGLSHLEMNRVIIVGKGIEDSNPMQIKNIFNVKGTIHADIGRVRNCYFSFFKTAFKSNNPEAVNWVFSENTFYPSSDREGFESAVIFDISQMNDNFIVENNSIILRKNEKLLRAIGTGYKHSHLAFIFSNNRFETQVQKDENSPIIEMDYGKLIMNNSTFTNGSSGIFNQKIEIKGKAMAIFNNVFFSNPTFSIPIVDSSLRDGSLEFTAIELNNSRYARYYNIVFNDGITEYPLLTKLTTDTKSIVFNGWRAINVVYEDIDYSLYGGGIYLDGKQKRNKIVRFSKQGRAINQKIRVNPFSTITNIKLINVPIMPYPKARIYFGLGDIQQTLDVNVEGYNVSKQNEVLIFNGQAIIYDNNYENHGIRIVLLDSEGNEIISGVDFEVELQISESDFSLLKADGTEKVVINNHQSEQTTN